LIKALKNLYPNYQWKYRPLGYWNNLENQRKFLEEVAPSLGVKTLEDWNKITVNQFRQIGGSSGTRLLQIYGNSLDKILKTLYPNHQWKIKRKPRGYWKNLDNQRAFLDQIRSSLGIKNLNDWNNVTTVQLVQVGGSRMLTMYGSLQNMLKDIYQTNLDIISSKKNIYIYKNKSIFKH
jgi:hypothetical protein